MDNPLRGILLKCLSVLVLTVMAAIVKATSAGGLGVPPGQQVFFRSFFAIPVIVLWLVLNGNLRTGLRTRQPMEHVYRGVAGTVAMTLYFWAYALLPFPEVVALSYATPLLVVLFAALFLGEKVRLFSLSMIGLGLGGVLIVLSPQLGLGAEAAVAERSRMIGAAAALGAATLAGLAQVFVRKMVRSETASAIAFWFSVTGSVFGLLTLPFGWVMPDAQTLALLVMIGLLGGVGQILLTTAYRYGEASLIAPFEYVSIVLSAAIGWFIFDEATTRTTLTGSVVVVLAGIALIWREHQLGLKRGPQRAAQTPQG